MQTFQTIACSPHCGNSSELVLYLNAPIHKAKVIASWIEENQVDVMSCPAQNPYRNPIKHLWDELEHRLRAGSIRPKAKQELFIMFQEECKKIPPSVYQNLVENLPRRVNAVILSYTLLVD